MTKLFTNDATTKIVAPIGTFDTNISLTPGDGAKFPQPESGDSFTGVLIKQNGVKEIVKVTGRNTDTLVVMRAQEGTAPATFSGGDRFEHRLTAGDLTELQESIETASNVGSTAQAAADVADDKAEAAQIDADNAGTAATSARNFAKAMFPTGTRITFQQSNAPTGWTKDITKNQNALRVVSGPVSSGGTLDFSTVFVNKSVNGSVGSTSLSESQLPPHAHRTDNLDGGGNHAVQQFFDGPIDYRSNIASGGDANYIAGSRTAIVGSGAGHTHSLNLALDFNVKYVDVIIAQRDNVA